MTYKQAHLGEGFKRIWLKISLSFDWNTTTGYLRHRRQYVAQGYILKWSHELGVPKAMTARHFDARIVYLAVFLNNSATLKMELYRYASLKKPHWI